MSESVKKALKLMGGPDAAKTLEFVEYMNKIFDIVSVSNFVDGFHWKKMFQLP